MHCRTIVFALLAAACAIEVDDPFPSPDGPAGDAGSDDGGSGPGGDGSFDSGGGEDGGGSADTGGNGSDDGGPTIDYDATIQPIWNTNCIGCHGNNQPDEGLNLTLGARALIGIASSQLSSMPLVTPGGPEQSYLWHKLVGSQEIVGGSGEQMPERAPPLDSTDLQVISEWIESGAPP